MLHFSYLHKDTLTLFWLTIINSLPFNSLQVPEFDFLFRMRQDSNLRWTYVNRLTVYCLRPLGNAYIFFISKNLNFFNKSFWIIKNLFPRFSYFQPSFFFKKKTFFKISVFLFLKSFMLFIINFNTKFSVR